MGASAKIRKAKKRAAQQYYDAVADLEPVNENLRPATNTRRAVSEGDFDSRTKRLARELDKTGRAIRNDEGYKDALSRYNNRYRALKEQVAGRSVSRFSVSDNPREVQESRSNAMGIASGGTRVLGGSDTAPRTGMDAIISGVSTESAGKRAAQTQFFDSAEEAQAEAQKRMEAFNRNRPLSSSGPVGLISRSQVPEATDPSLFVNEERLPGISVGYRQLNDFKDAFDEMGAYADTAQASPTTQYADRYAALSKQLNSRLKRQADTPKQGIGLLNSELATGAPMTEVIT